MSDSINKHVRQQAALFVLGGLSQRDQIRFEQRIKTDPELKALIDELSSTLEISRVAGKKRPSPEFLQGQRNLLRHRITEHESRKKPARLAGSIFDSIATGSRRLLTARQPAWAIATYIMIAFIGGIIITRSGSTGALETAEQFVHQKIETGNPVKISYIEDSSVSFQVMDKPRIQLAGDTRDAEVRNMLYYSLLNDQNDGNRMKAINMIEDFDQDMVTMDVLIHALLNEPNPGIRLKTIRALKKYEPNAVLVQACTKVLLNDINDAVRQEALGILSTWNESDIIPVLQVVSGMDENEHIRSESRRILHQIQFSRENEIIEMNQ